jgi:hypothetical protein
MPCSKANNITPNAAHNTLPGRYKMELDNINAGHASHEGVEKKQLQEIEKAEDVDIAKHDGETIDYAAEKRLVRKLDFW